MRSTMTDIQNWCNLLNNTSHLQSQVIEAQLDKFKTGAWCQPNRPKFAHPDNSGDHSKGKEWLWTIPYYMELQPKDFALDESGLDGPCPSSRRDVQTDSHRRPMTTESHMTINGSRPPGMNFWPNSRQSSTGGRDCCISQAGGDRLLPRKAEHLQLLQHLPEAHLRGWTYRLTYNFLKIPEGVMFKSKPYDSVSGHNAQEIGRME
jgi:hypothetical protein